MSRRFCRQRTAPSAELDLVAAHASRPTRVRPSACRSVTPGGYGSAERHVAARRVERDEAWARRSRPVRSVASEDVHAVREQGGGGQPDQLVAAPDLAPGSPVERHAPRARWSSGRRDPCRTSASVVEDTSADHRARPVCASQACTEPPSLVSSRPGTLPSSTAVGHDLSVDRPVGRGVAVRRHQGRPDPAVGSLPEDRQGAVGGGAPGPAGCPGSPDRQSATDREASTRSSRTIAPSRDRSRSAPLGVATATRSPAWNTLTGPGPGVDGSPERPPLGTGERVVAGHQQRVVGRGGHHDEVARERRGARPVLEGPLREGRAVRRVEDDDLGRGGGSPLEHAARGHDLRAVGDQADDPVRCPPARAVRLAGAAVEQHQVVRAPWASPGGAAWPSRRRPGANQR